VSSPFISGNKRGIAVASHSSSNLVMGAYTRFSDFFFDAFDSNVDIGLHSDTTKFDMEF
jgi:hypothetical protein